VLSMGDGIVICHLAFQTQQSQVTQRLRLGVRVHLNRKTMGMVVHTCHSS
jgi:hypothetical protein